MDLVERLRNTPLFRFVPTEGLTLVASIAQEHRVEAGTILCRQADLGSTFFLIDRGEALIQRVDDKGFQRPVGVLRDGDSFGITSLFLIEPRDATVIARTPMRFWTIQRSDFQGLLRRYPVLWEQLTIPEDIRARQRMPRFDWLAPAENVIVFCHRHWFALVKAIAWPTGLLILFLALLTVVVEKRLFLFDPTPLLILGCGAYLAVAVWHWFDWLNDYIVVTNQRVSYRQRVAFISESRSEVPIDRVQNINVIVGFWGKLLGYGTMFIETAAVSGTLTLRYVPDPETVRQRIWDQFERTLATQRATERRLMAETLASHLGIDLGERVPGEIPGSDKALFDRLEEEGPLEEPSRWSKTIGWLRTIPILPRVCIETPDQIIWRKHPFFLFLKILPALLLAMVSIPLALLAHFGFPSWPGRWGDYYGFGMLALAIFSLAWLAWEANDWNNDLYIVTNDRIIDVEQKPFFLRSERREASLGMIQNVRFEIPNPWAALLNYGSVLIQTAGRGDFTFDKVSNPAGVQAEIFRRIEVYRERMRQNEAARRRQEMAQWFDVYGELERLAKGASLPPEPPKEEPKPNLDIEKGSEPDGDMGPRRSTL